MHTCTPSFGYELSVMSSSLAAHKETYQAPANWTPCQGLQMSEHEADGHICYNKLTKTKNTCHHV